MDGLTKSILLWRDRRSVSANYRTMTVQFEVKSSECIGTYLDDAVDMPYGKESDAVSQWQEFFGYKPCIFKNGAVVGYLDPDNYAQFEDGTSADITSGDAGDVMVEFPRRGIKINKISDSNDIIVVSMTDDPNADGFTYYAHTRGSVSKDYFYIGAYEGYIDSNNKLRSLSGIQPSTSDTWGSLLTPNRIMTYADNCGSGYTQLPFYQMLFIQCMYLLQFKGDVDILAALGKGYGSSYKNYATCGVLNTSGLIYGSSSRKTQIKLFGLEGLYGNTATFVNGYIMDKNMWIYTTTDNFNNTASGYTKQKQIAYGYFYGYVNSTIGDVNLGFTVDGRDGARSGSSSFYYKQYVYVSCPDDCDFVGLQFILGLGYGPSNRFDSASNADSGRLAYL